MKITLQEKLDQYKSTISQQTLDPSSIKKVGLTSAAAMAAIVSVPLELSSQVICGNIGAPTRTVGACNGDLAPLTLYDCARFDFDGDGVDELQIYYYNWSGYPNAYAYLDPIGVNLSTVNIAYYISLPQSANEITTPYSTYSQDRIYIVPLSGGPGFGFIALDADAWPWLNGIDAHPTTGQPICCTNSALPSMWGGRSDISIADFVAENADPNACFGIVALPVELSKFEAIANKESVTLNWTTESEVNNAGFAIERSMDGEEYREIGFVDGQGESKHTVDYTYEDKNIEEGATYYYRLRQIDYDGGTELSDTKHVVTQSSKSTLTFGPNPVSDVLEVQLNAKSSGNATIDIISISGEVLKSQQFDQRQGRNLYDVDLSTLANGVVFMKVNDGVTTFYEKVIINR